MSGLTFGAYREGCDSRRSLQIERRPGNALNVEIGTPMDRCLRQSPDGRGMAWLLSGGELLAYGICAHYNCPKLKEELRAALSRSGSDG